MTSSTTYTQTWDLESLAPSPDTEDFTALLKTYRTDLLALADRADSLPALNSADPDVLAEWEEFLKSYEGVASRGTELDAFIGCHAAADANNRQLHGLEAELSSLGPQRARIAMALQLGLQAASPEQLVECLAASPELERIGYWLSDQRTLASLRLPRDQELLAAELDVDGLHAWGRLYDRLSGALRISVMEQGELVERSPGQIQFDSADRTVRQNNYFASVKAWRSVSDTCSDALNHIAGTRLTKYRRLGLQDHLSAPLHFNRMERQTLEAMWSAVDDRKDTLLGYLSSKSRLLGLDHLCWYDLQAPLPTTSSDAAEIDYDTGCSLIIDAFGRFSPDFGEFARTTIVDNWIDASSRWKAGYHHSISR